jgi:hypothetical protein
MDGGSAACRRPHGVVIRDDLSHPASVREDADAAPGKATAVHGLIAKFKIEIAIAYTLGDSS